MNIKEIATLREICNNATVGPLTINSDIEPWIVRTVDGRIVANFIPKSNSFGMTTSCANASFFKEASTALPKALDEIDRLLKLNIPLTDEINKQAEIIDDFKALINHALELGYLGEGSTKAWAQDLLKGCK